MTGPPLRRFDEQTPLTLSTASWISIGAEKFVGILSKSFAATGPGLLKNSMTAKRGTPFKTIPASRDREFSRERTNPDLRMVDKVTRQASSGRYAWDMNRPKSDISDAASASGRQWRKPGEYVRIENSIRRNPGPQRVIPVAKAPAKIPEVKSTTPSQFSEMSTNPKYIGNGNKNTNNMKRDDSNRKSSSNVLRVDDRRNTFPELYDIPNKRRKMGEEFNAAPSDRNFNHLGIKTYKYSPQNEDPRFSTSSSNVKQRTSLTPSHPIPLEYNPDAISNEVSYKNIPTSVNSRDPDVRSSIRVIHSQAQLPSAKSQMQSSSNASSAIPSSVKDKTHIAQNPLISPPSDNIYVAVDPNVHNDSEISFDSSDTSSVTSSSSSSDSSDSTDVRREIQRNRRHKTKTNVSLDSESASRMLREIPYLVNSVCLFLFKLDYIL